MIASARARARGERAHSIERCTNEFLDPKNPHLDTKVIKIGQQEGARGFVHFFNSGPMCIVFIRACNLCHSIFKITA